MLLLKISGSLLYKNVNDDGWVGEVGGSLAGEVGSPPPVLIESDYTIFVV